jgi:hypothetical protein
MTKDETAVCIVVIHLAFLMVVYGWLLIRRRYHNKESDK